MSNQVIPVEQKEYVEVTLLLEVTDCYHMGELIMVPLAALSKIGSFKKISIIDMDLVVVDPDTGEQKYGLDIDIDQQDYYRCITTTHGTVETLDGQLVYDINEDLK